MSSGFVLGGTSDAPIERSDDWLAAQKEIEANIQKKAEAARQTDGRSLFETLEANKAAKQEAFEEASRLKNQFRALDEDEVDFLDSVLESTRAEEARIKKETAEGLSLFRQQQEEADTKARLGSDGIKAKEGSPVAEEGSWAAGGRKRKRIKEKEVLKGVKIRRSSTTDEFEKRANVSAATSPADNPKAKESMEERYNGPKTSPPSKSNQEKASSAEATKPPAPVRGSLGLVSYSSDDDDW